MTSGIRLQRPQTASIRRMLDPNSVAIVGASDKNPFLGRLLENATSTGIEFVLVNPNQTEVFGYPTVHTLLEAGRAIDTVFSLVSADNSVQVVRDAVRVGAGGVIITAARFGESGVEGMEREQTIKEIARDSGLAICGPNCIGFFNVAKSVHLYIGAERKARKGHVALLSQSGGLFTTLQLAANEKKIGFSHLISTGNEAATDLVDFLDFLIDDSDTAAIGMVVEQVRRPQAFLEAAARARKAGKFLVALKIGRSPGGQRASASHTGAVMGDAREYDVAFRQAGVEVASDLDDLLGLLQLFSHWPVERWGSGRKTAVLTASGGVAALVADAFHESGLLLAHDAEIESTVKELIPGTLSANPLDITGVYYNDPGFTQLLDLFLASSMYDTIVAVNYLQEGMERFAAPISEPLRRAAMRTDKRLIVASAAETAAADWAEGLLDDGVALGIGIGATVRSLAAMDRFVADRQRPEPEVVPQFPRPSPARIVNAAGVSLLSFGDAMALLETFGIPTAPHVIGATAAAELARWSNFVVKLADVPHRTEIGAVAVGVSREDLAGATEKMRQVAEAHDLPTDIVIQPILEVGHELFIGIQGSSTFGPMLLFGIGGITIEALGDVSMRIAPISEEDARSMLGELRAGRLLDDFRGRPGVDREALVRILVNAGRLAAATSSWLESLDINPLISNRDGLAAVDVAVIISPSSTNKES